MSDDQYLKLLEELNQYDYELEQLSQFFSIGFNQLSRANYYNKDSMVGGKYGSMYYDMNYEGQLYVYIDKKDNLMDILKKKQRVVEPNSKDENDLKQRGFKDEGQSKSAAIKEEEVDKKKGPYDPIKMFAGGFSVPRTLRQCQTNFQSSISVIQDLINRRNKLLKLMEEIEANQK
ncbi:vacuolar ATPase assembly protein Vma22p [Monosporozyma unispora]|nr:hypothetical protein C6P44_003431 [Kazachstania unispora]